MLTFLAYGGGRKHMGGDSNFSLSVKEFVKSLLLE